MAYSNRQLISGVSPAGPIAGSSGMGTDNSTSDCLSYTDSSKPHLFPDFKDFNEFSQTALKLLMQATRNSNALPSEGDDFDYYSSFASVRQELDIQGSRILLTIQDMMRYYSLRGNMSTKNSLTDIDDRFDLLVDANDQLLERVGTYLDEASGLKRDKPLIVVTKTPKSTPTHKSNNRSEIGASSSGSKSVGFRLLTAKNIARPQLSFRDKIDNMNRVFIPKLTVKPNALKSLEECMRLPEADDADENDPCFTYPHPYQFELDHFTPRSHQISKVVPMLPASLDLPVTHIEHEYDLKKLCEALKRETEIAVDLEAHSFRSFQGFTCLMQLSTRTNDYIIDALKLRQELHILNEVFTDPNIVKVLHGADQDIGWLQRDFGLYIVNMFDTGQAARALNYARFSLAFLLDFHCGIIADKQYQLADWRIRPLPPDFIKYAREDTHYLLYIYDRLKNELIEQDKGQNNLMSSVITRSTQICAKKYSKPRFTENSYKELYHQSKKSSFNSKQMDALCGLYTWRDRIARQEDESTGYVLPNHMLLQLAEILPRETAGILACCNPLPPLVRQHVSDLHEIIKNTRERPLEQPELSRPQLRPTLQQHPKYNIDVLTCPHDLSRQSADVNISDTLTTGSQSVGLEITVSLQQDSVLFKSGNCLTSDSPETAAKKRAACIYSSFVNPFLKFLPGESLNETSATSSQPRKVAPCDMWTLLPNSTKPVEVKPKPVVEVIRTAVHLDFGSDDIVEVKPDVVSLTEKFGGRPKMSKALKAQKLLSGDVKDCSADLKVKKEKKKKRKLEEATAVAEEAFTAYNYNKEDFDKLISAQSNETKMKKDKKTKKKRKEFNPGDTTTADSDFKAVTKPRQSQPTSNRSMSYGGAGGNSSNTPKIQWPSR